MFIFNHKTDFDIVHYEDGDLFGEGQAVTEFVEMMVNKFKFYWSLLHNPSTIFYLNLFLQK